MGNLKKKDGCYSKSQRKAFISSVSCVKQNVVERNRHEMQAVPAEMQTSIFAHPYGALKNTPQLTKYPHVLCDRVNENVH